MLLPMRPRRRWARPLRYVVKSPSDALIVAGSLDTPVVVLDMEPILAWWGTSSSALEEGISEAVRVLTGKSVLVLTNSARRLSPERLPSDWSLVARARKPWTPLRVDNLAVVVGDQLYNDGVLALRLEARFVHFPPPHDAPMWPRLCNAVSSPLRLAFQRGLWAEHDYKIRATDPGRLKAADPDSGSRR